MTARDGTASCPVDTTILLLLVPPMSKAQTLDSTSLEHLRFVVTEEVMTKRKPSLRRAINDAAEAVAMLMIGDLLAFALHGPPISEDIARRMKETVRTDPDLRAYLVGLRAAVRLRRKLHRGRRRRITRADRLQMAHACAEAYCRYHLDKQTASLATLLGHGAPAIRLAAISLAARVSGHSEVATVAPSGGRSR